jgi:hypothetical protein
VYLHAAKTNGQRERQPATMTERDACALLKCFGQGSNGSGSSSGNANGSGSGHGSGFIDRADPRSLVSLSGTRTNPD